MDIKVLISTFWRNPVVLLAAKYGLRTVAIPGPNQGGLRCGD
jgi:hypothetical protein